MATPSGSGPPEATPPIATRSRAIPTRDVAGSTRERDVAGSHLGFSLFSTTPDQHAVAGSLRGQSFLHHRHERQHAPTPPSPQDSGLLSVRVSHASALHTVGLMDEEMSTDEDTLDHMSHEQWLPSLAGPYDTEPVPADARNSMSGVRPSYLSSRQSIDAVRGPLLSSSSRLGKPDDEAEEEVQPGAVAGGGLPTKNAIQDATDAFIIGIINTIVTLPVTLAYATLANFILPRRPESLRPITVRPPIIPIRFTAIMFPDHFFRPYMSALAKLVFFGSSIHQLVFSLTSTFPFAIGQVQDVGLIFLSAMSSSVVSLLQDQGETRASVILTTTLLSITLSTLVVGILLILVGKNKLAGYIAYMPLPVVAGYLGYVGYFCLAAGASQASGLTIASIPSWLTLFSGDALYKSLVAIVSFVFIYTTLRYWHHPLAMPTVLLAVPIVYYVALGVCMHTYDWNWDTMRQWLGDNDWITLPPPGAGHETPWEVYQLYALYPPSADSVAWGVLVRQVPVTLALFFVVTFGSCLDITAIQADLPYEVDYNRELVTVGLSNCVTGLLGAGFTGSYIFSQTIFTQRSGCQNRLNGYVIVVAELLLFLIPRSFVEFLPNFYYGALMLVFGLEIAADWLVFSCNKFSRAEFVLTWINFICIMIAVARLPVSGLEVGIGIGILICAVHFAMEYSNVQLKTLTLVSSRSNCVRPVSQRKVLELFQANSVAMSLTGYIFFGSTVLIGDRVKGIAHDIRERVESPPDIPAPAAPLLEPISHMPPRAASLAVPSAASPFPAVEMKDIHAACLAAKRFMLLDFRSVTGLDATAAAAFKTLYSTLDQMRVTLVLTGLPPGSSMASLLQGNGAIAINSDWEGARCCPSFETMEEGLAWCERHFLQEYARSLTDVTDMQVAQEYGQRSDTDHVAQEYGILPPPSDCLTLTDVMDMHLAVSQTDDATGTSTLLPSISHADAAASMQHFMTLRSLSLDEVIFDIGSPADAFYIVLSGEVTCEVDFGALDRDAYAAEGSAVASHRKMRYLQYTAGGVTGDQDFFLQRKRQFRAYCSAPGDVLVLSQSKYCEMMTEQPQLVVLLQHIILRNELYSSSNAIELLQRARIA